MSQYHAQAERDKDAIFEWLLSDQMANGAHSNAIVTDTDTTVLEWFRDAATELAHKCNTELRRRIAKSEGSEQ